MAKPRYYSAFREARKKNAKQTATSLRKLDEESLSSSSEKSEVVKSTSGTQKSEDELRSRSPPNPHKQDGTQRPQSFSDPEPLDQRSSFRHDHNDLPGAQVVQYRSGRSPFWLDLFRPRGIPTNDPEVITESPIPEPRDMIHASLIKEALTKFHLAVCLADEDAGDCQMRRARNLRYIVQVYMPAMCKLRIKKHQIVFYYHGLRIDWLGNELWDIISEWESWRYEEDAKNRREASMFLQQIEESKIRLRDIERQMMQWNSGSITLSGETTEIDRRRDTGLI